MQKCLYENFRWILVVARSFSTHPKFISPSFASILNGSSVETILFERKIFVSFMQSMLVRIAAWLQVDHFMVHEIPCLWCWWNETSVEHGHWRCAVLNPIFSCRDLTVQASEEIPWAKNCWMLEEVFRRTRIYPCLALTSLLTSVCDGWSKRCSWLDGALATGLCHEKISQVALELETAPIMRWGH